MEVAVFDPVPIFRLGLLASLGFGGVELSTPDELVDWAQARTGILVYTVLDDDDGQLPVPRGRPIETVAVLETFTVARAATLLRSGAANVLDHAAPVSEFRRVVDETRAGFVTLPAEVLRAAIAKPATPQQFKVSDVEMRWLRDLAAGSGVSALAASADFSERMMYRKLADLYRRLGVKNRTQALMAAHEQGWL